MRIYKVDDPRKAAGLPANIRDGQGGQYRLVPYNWPNTILQNLENRVKRVASGIMEEIELVPEEKRLQYGIETMKNKSVHALFKHYIPTDDRVAKMLEANSRTGKGQPKGLLDIEAFVKNGSYGMYLKGYEELLEDPITEGDMMRNWLCAKVAMEYAMKAARIPSSERGPRLRPCGMWPAPPQSQGCAHMNKLRRTHRHK